MTRTRLALLAIAAIVLFSLPTQAQHPDQDATQIVFPDGAGGWNTVSASDPLPTTAGGGGGSSDVNIDEIGGVAVGSTSLPVDDASGSLSVDDDGGSITVDTPQLPTACTNPYKGASETIAGTSTDLAVTISDVCASGTCNRLTISNVGSGPVMLQFNGSTGADGVCLFTSAEPTLLSTLEVTGGGMATVTSVHATNTGTTSCPSTVTPAATELTLYGCD